MLVGYMRNFKEPSYLTNLIATLCKGFGIELIYLRPRDINVNKKTANGKMLINNQWTEIETDIPKFIDISPYCFKKENKEIVNFLRKYTLLSDNGLNRLNKYDFLQSLKKDDKFKRLVIPTIKAESLKDVIDFLNQHSKVVLKPISGQFGRNVYILNQEGSNFILKYKKTEEQLSYDEVKKLLLEEIIGNNFIAQKYIASKTIQGHPFDCRIHLEKDKDGKWVIVNKFIRIGIGQKIISNVNGGAISRPQSFLQANFDNKSKQIYNKLQKLAKIVPIEIEKITNSTLMNMGIDVGIDEKGNMYIFEINSFPIVAPQRSKIALIRSGYYKYRLDPSYKLNKELLKYKKKIRELTAENNQLKKENEFNKTMISSLKESTSWKVTKPLRVIGRAKRILR